MALRCCVFIAVSLDGFIARKNGDLSWLEDEANLIPGEDFGFRAFFDTVDTLVLGRKTYEVALKFPQWPYEGKRVIVLSHSTLAIPSSLPDQLEAVNLCPAELVRYLESTGSQTIYVDGGETIRGFIRAGLIDEMTITVIPILLGSGVALFAQLEKDARLGLQEVKTFKNGYVQIHYLVQKE